MGVRFCNRKGCEELMCTNYIQSVGYICKNCISGFKEYLSINNLNLKTRDQIVKELNIFIDTHVQNQSITVDEFFKESEL